MDFKEMTPYNKVEKALVRRRLEAKIAEFRERAEHTKNPNARKWSMGRVRNMEATLAAL